MAEGPSGAARDPRPDKWRPSLALVVACTIAVVLCLPLTGIVAVNLLSPVMGGGGATALVSVGVVVIAAYVGWVLRRILLRPIAALARRAHEIREGTAARGSLPHYGTVEMAALGEAMLDMSATLESRAAVLRTYADHVTHELKSPLTVVRGAAELLELPDLPQEERQRLMAQVGAAVTRMTALLDAQRALARADEPMPPGVCHLSDLGLAMPPAVIAADAEMPVSTALLSVVLGHLVDNALAHGATEVRLTATPDKLLVADNGRGISAGNRARIFDAHFTTRRGEGGTGMGLAIVRRLLAAQGARIHLDPGQEAGAGAVFMIDFKPV